MTLSEPSAELAKRLLAEVDFDNRLVGYKMHRRKGPSPVSLYSFEEVVGFLMTPTYQIDFDELEQWVRSVMDDPELADIIGRQNTKNISHIKKAEIIRNLMAQRILQCRAQQ